MCINARKDIEIQCARKYWKDHWIQREGSYLIIALSEEQHMNLPTENLVCEQQQF